MELGQKKPWSGRFSSAPDVRSLAFTASIGFDQRFIFEDIRGSVAHVRMLGRQSIVLPEEAAEIERGLWLIWDEAEAESIVFTLEDEDIHSGVERRLRELIGPVQARLHTGEGWLHPRRHQAQATDNRRSACRSCQLFTPEV